MFLVCWRLQLGAYPSLAPTMAHPHPAPPTSQVLPWVPPFFAKRSLLVPYILYKVTV